MAPLSPLSFMSPLQRNGAHSVFSKVRFPQHLSGSWQCPIYSFTVLIQSQNVSNVQVCLWLSVSSHPSVSSKTGLICHAHCWVLHFFQGVCHTTGAQSTFGNARALTVFLCNHTNCTTPLDSNIIYITYHFAFERVCLSREKTLCIAALARSSSELCSVSTFPEETPWPSKCEALLFWGRLTHCVALSVAYHAQLECVCMARSLLHKARDGFIYLSIHSI